jgi:hypothetical protein
MSTFEDWEDYEEEEPGGDTPLPVPVVVRPSLGKTEPCLLQTGEHLHLREADHVFTLCGQRSAQGLVKDDERRSWPVCPLCSSVAGGDPLAAR